LPERLNLSKISASGLHKLDEYAFPTIDEANTRYADLKFYFEMGYWANGVPLWLVDWANLAHKTPESMLFEATYSLLDTYRRAYRS
jgi:hypothetical protein